MIGKPLGVRVRHGMLVSILLFGVGCGPWRPLPRLDRPKAITIVAMEVPEWGIMKQRTIEVRSRDIDAIYDIVKPDKWVAGDIHESVHFLLARVTFKYSDRPDIELYVRWMGNGPL